MPMPSGMGLPPLVLRRDGVRPSLPKFNFVFSPDPELSHNSIHDCSWIPIWFRTCLRKEYYYRHHNICSSYIYCLYIRILSLILHQEFVIYFILYDVWQCSVWYSVRYSVQCDVSCNVNNNNEYKQKQIMHIKICSRYN